MQEEVCLKEVTQLFLTNIIPKIREETEVPQVIFEFPESAYPYFYDILNYPSSKEERFLPTLAEKDIKNLKVVYDGITPVILIHDPVLFFELLTQITNHLIILYRNYGYVPSIKHLCISILTRIWLRMSPTDFHEVETFLRRQLEFIKDDTFSTYIPESVWTTHNNYTITLMNELNSTNDESTRRMQFTMYDEHKIPHSLPSIYYDILNTGEEKICYIYAIQNRRFKKVNPKIEKLLYQINEGIIPLESKEYLEYRQGLYDTYYPENIVDVYPSQIVSLLCFVSLLKKHNITHIKVPTLQVLSYDFHLLLSETAKQNFPQKWSLDKIKQLEEEQKIYGEGLRKEYLWDKTWYSHIVDKEDFISCNKTETFLRIFRRASYHNSEINILSDPMIESDYLEIRINKPKQKVKSQC